MIMNPTIISNEMSVVRDPMENEMKAAMDKTLPVQQQNGGSRYNILLVINSLLWVAYFLGWLE